MNSFIEVPRENLEQHYRPEDVVRAQELIDIVEVHKHSIALEFVKILEAVKELENLHITYKQTSTDELLVLPIKRAVIVYEFEDNEKNKVLSFKIEDKMVEENNSLNKEWVI